MTDKRQGLSFLMELLVGSCWRLRLFTVETRSGQLLEYVLVDILNSRSVEKDTVPCVPCENGDRRIVALSIKKLG